MENITYKLIFDNAKDKKNQTIPFDDLWNIIKKSKECKDKKVTNSIKLKKVCARLEDEGKIFISENNEISLI